MHTRRTPTGLLPLFISIVLRFTLTSAKAGSSNKQAHVFSSSPCSPRRGLGAVYLPPHGLHSGRMGREGGWAIKVIKWTLLFLRFHSQRSPRLGVPFACSVCLPSTLSGLSTLHNPFGPIVCARMFFTRMTLVSLKRYLVHDAERLM